MKEVLANPDEVLVPPVTAMEPRTVLRMMLPWIAAALVLGAIVAGVAVWKFKPVEPRHVTRFDYNLPEGQRFSGAFPIAVSPDGRRFVYSASKGLYLRSLDELTAKPIAGTEGGGQRRFFHPTANGLDISPPLMGS